MPDEPQLTTIFLDLLPNQPQNEETRQSFQQMLRLRLESKLPQAAERIWDLPPAMVKAQGEYLSLLIEARDLYILGHFYSCVAMCGIVGERLVKDALRTTVFVQRSGSLEKPSDVAFDQLERVEVNGLIRFLGRVGLISNGAVKAVNDLLELRNQYAHARGKNPQPDALQAIKLLDSLVAETVSVFNEFEIKDGSLVPRSQRS